MFLKSAFQSLQKDLVVSQFTDSILNVKKYIASQTIWFTSLIHLVEPNIVSYSESVFNYLSCIFVNHKSISNNGA